MCWPATSPEYYLAAGPDYPLCRLYHGRGPPSPGGPDQPINCQIFTTLCWCWCLNVQCGLKRKKKVVNFLGEEKCSPREKILGTRIRIGPPPYIGIGPPRMVNPALPGRMTWSTRQSWRQQDWRHWETWCPSGGRHCSRSVSTHMFLHAKLFGYIAIALVTGSIWYSRSRNVEGPTTDRRQSERRRHQATGAGRV